MALCPSLCDWAALELTCQQAGQGGHPCARSHQRGLVGVALVPRQLLLQPLVHGHGQHPVPDLLPLLLLGTGTEQGREWAWGCLDAATLQQGAQGEEDMGV